MEDIEKQRVEYVAHLEAQLQHAQEELAKYKPLAEKWEPKIAGSIDPHDKQARFTLSFGGKRVTGAVSLSNMTNNTPADITASVAETLFESLVVEHLRTVLLPEVERVKASAEAIMKAGTW